MKYSHFLLFIYFPLVNYSNKNRLSVVCGVCLGRNFFESFFDPVFDCRTPKKNFRGHPREIGFVSFRPFSKTQRFSSPSLSLARLSPLSTDAIICSLAICVEHFQYLSTGRYLRIRISNLSLILFSVCCWLESWVLVPLDLVPNW